MKRKIMAVLMTALMVASVIMLLGSGGTVIDVMKQVPNVPNAELIYIDLENLRKDDDLAYLWEDKWKDEVVWLFKKASIPEVSISTNKLDYLAYIKDNPLCSFYLIGGNFDLKKIRSYLEDEDWQQDTYRGMEVWYRERGNINEIALFEDEIIIGKKGDVKGIIQVMKGEVESLYDNKDAMDVVNKLPKGFYYAMVTAVIMDSEAYANATMMVYSREKISKEEIEIQTIFKFKDERAAEDSAKQLEEQYPDLEVIVQDEYLIYSRIWLM